MIFAIKIGLLSLIWNEIWSAAMAQSSLEWIALVSNLIYVVLAAKGNRWCWWWGALGAITSFVVLNQVNLFSDAMLQVYYLAMAIYGWVTWNAHQKDESVEIIRMPTRLHLQIIILGSLLTIALGTFWSNFAASFPYLDGATTGFSLLATWLVAKRYLENWLYWIVIDVIGIGIYYVKELYLFSFLFIVYTIIAVVGWYAWKSKYQKTPTWVKP